MEKVIKEDCYKILKEYVENNKTELMAVAPQLTGDISDIKLEDVIIGEKPQFRNYKFNVEVTAPVVFDAPYYDWDEGRTKTKMQHFANLVHQPFEGCCWLMENEEKSDITICKENIDLVNKCFNGKIKKFFSLSDKQDAATFVGEEEANRFAFLSTVNHPKQAYVNYVLINDDFKCELANDKTILVPLLPIYLKLKNGGKVLIGTYFIDDKKFVINFYGKEVEDYRTKKAEEAENAKKKKTRIKSLIIAMGDIIVIAITLAILLPKIL